MVGNNMDHLLEEAVKVVIQYDRATASLLQRRLSIGYARAARILDQLETTGVLAEPDGSSKPREVLVKDFKEFKEKNSDILATDKNEEVNGEVKKYVPVMCDFLPDELKSLNNPTELPYLKSDLKAIGNLIVTGNVISKKYEYLKVYLLFLLSKFNLNDIRLIINDNTGMLKDFKSIPHLLTPITDSSEESLSALRWLCREMDRRIMILNKNNDEKFPAIVYIGTPFNSYDLQIEDTIKRLSSMGAYAGIHLILIGDRLGDFPKAIKDNIPARLEFNKFGENEAVFTFKEKTKVSINELKGSDIKDYLLEVA